MSVDQGNIKQIRISLAIQSEKKMMENSVNLKHRHRAPQLTYNYVDLCIINSKKQWLNICTAKCFFLSFTVISTRFYMHTQNKSSTSVLKYGSLIKSTRKPAFLCNSQRYITIYGLQCCNNHERVTCLCLNLCAFFWIKMPRFWI